MDKKEYDRLYHAKRSPEAKLRKNKLQAERIHRHKKLLIDYLKDHPCVDCGESDIVVLDFDHVSGDKVRHVTDCVRLGFSWNRIVEEIQKCVIRCANCHRRKTAKERDWYRYLSEN